MIYILTICYLFFLDLVLSSPITVFLHSSFFNTPLITKLIPYPIAIPPIIIKTISCKLNLFAVKDHIPAIVPQTIIEPEEI